MSNESPSTSMLAARNISCGYGSTRVLHDVSLSLGKQWVTAIVGPNGAGKSTLLRACAGQLPIPTGSIQLDGRKVADLHEREIAQRLSYVPQAEERSWPFSVEQAVALGRIPHHGWWQAKRSADQSLIEAALHATELLDLRNRSITELSGGEWRRVALARCLAQQAQVLLLDEPVAGLDLRYQHEMLTLIRKLATDQSLAVGVVLHDLNHAARFADEIVLLNHGSVVINGSPAEALTAARLSSVYGLPVSVMKHPDDGSILITPASDAHVI